MINEGDMLLLYRPRMFNNYHELSALASNTYNKKKFIIYAQFLLWHYV